MIYSLIKSIYNQIRVVTPKKYVSYSGIAIKHGRLFDISDEREFKPEGVNMIKDHIRKDDHITEVATGHGVFSLICSVIGATVDSYEYDSGQIADAETLHKLIGVDNMIDINQGFVCERENRPSNIPR